MVLNNNVRWISSNIESECHIRCMNIVIEWLEHLINL